MSWIRIIMQCLKALRKLLRTVQARTESPRAATFHTGKVLPLSYVKMELTSSHFEVNVFGHKEQCLILLPLCVGICFKCGSFNREEKNNVYRVIPVSKARFIDTHSMQPIALQTDCYIPSVYVRKNTELCFFYLSRTNQTRW